MTILIFVAGKLPLEPSSRRHIYEFVCGEPYEKDGKYLINWKNILHTKIQARPTYLRLEICVVYMEYVFIVFFKTNHRIIYICTSINSLLKPVFQYTKSFWICVSRKRIINEYTVGSQETGVKCASLRFLMYKYNLYIEMFYLLFPFLLLVVYFLDISPVFRNILVFVYW